MQQCLQYKPLRALQNYIKYIQKNGCSCFHLTRYWVLEIYILQDPVTNVNVM